MERPSHIAFSKSQTVSRRMVSFGLAVSFPLLVIWALMIGLTGGHQTWNPGGLVVRLDQDEVKPLPPPLPDPEMQKAENITAKLPDFYVDREPSERTVTAYGNGGTVTPPADPVPVGPDRTAVSIASTHTTPPYPLLAQRVGAEGKVTLRLTVLSDGSVGMAEIVTSSGRSDLDEAARAWIVRHWTYQPALDKGRPVISHVVASILFRLDNAR